MSINNYADLQSAIANWLHRSDLTSIVPDLIMLGEKRILREVRCLEMETALNVTISSGVAALPADYLDLKHAYIDGTVTQALSRCTAAQIYEQYPLRSSGGKPAFVAREGSNFIFGPYPDSSYTVKGTYYAKPTSIQSSANAVFVAHPDLYLFAALLEAAPYLKNDTRLTVWESKFSNVVAQIAQQEAREIASGGAMQVRAA